MNALTIIAPNVGADTFLRFGTALALGLMIGLEREFAHRRASGSEQPELFGGTRTFALFALLGCTGAQLVDITSSVLPLVSVIVVGGALIVSAYIAVFRTARIGMTTEVAALFTILLGALCRWTDLSLPIGLGVSVSLVLELKPRSRSLVAALAPADVLATLKFAVISAIVLPILPRGPIAKPPFDVWVPYDLWLVVVLVSAISFSGYVLHKLIGARQGIAIAATLGGLVSSTAVTLSFARRERNAPGIAPVFAGGVLLAWSITFVRVAVLAGVINAPLLAPLWPTLLAGALLCGGAALALFARTAPGSDHADQNLSNPFELTPALSFGVVYAAILLIAHVAPMYLGASGIYLTSLISGFADVDAITASLAHLTHAVSPLALSTAARGIALALIANTIVKGCIAAVAGDAALRRLLLPASGVIAALLVVVLLLTPGA